MKKNTDDATLTERLIKLADENKRDEITGILCSELSTVKVSSDSRIYFCSCGYPIAYGKESINHKNESEYSSELIKEILKEDADFDHYRLEYYCPKCGTFLTEVQC